MLLLIARQIGKVLNAREPKIVNGPEILNKYVGGLGEKVRELFAEAEKEQLEMGNHSMMHIVILDEMDAVCKVRGSGKSDSGVSDSVVNQLLSKIDGVDSLNNILLIGMTNRKDMIDDALLRPGRLEVHVEIGLPDSKGRLQILGIHMRIMKESGRIDPELIDRLGDISKKAKNYSGAEIELLVKAATSYALTRCVDLNDLSKALDEKNLIVQFDDFERALGDVAPKFGANQREAAEDRASALEASLAKCRERLLSMGFEKRASEEALEVARVECDACRVAIDDLRKEIVSVTALEARRASLELSLSEQRSALDASREEEIRRLRGEIAEVIRKGDREKKW